jgi:DNA-binding MarR family transcriptional regulator
LVDRAEQRGLVERIPSADDRRSFGIRVTEKGRKLSRVVEKEVNAEVMKRALVLSKSDRDRLASLVGQVVAGASAASG